MKIEIKIEDSDNALLLLEIAEAIVECKKSRANRYMINYGKYHVTVEHRKGFYKAIGVFDEDDK